MNDYHEIELLENLFEYIIPKYTEVHNIMTSMLDFPITDNVRVAELGCGFGELSKVIYKSYPGAVIFGLDKHEIILTRAKQRLAEFKDQFVPFCRDLNDNTWTNEISQLHAVMSSFTLDYLPPQRHKELISEAFEILEPTGRWVSCEFFQANDDRINRVFHDLEVSFIQKALQDGLVTVEQIEQLTTSAILRQKHHVVTIDQKIHWLKEAGFKSIDVPWRFLNIAIISASK